MKLAPASTRLSQKILALLTGLTFLIYGILCVTRWEYLEGLYHLAAIASLIGGIALPIIYWRPAPKVLRIVCHILLFIAVVSPLDALAFFLVMRPPLRFVEWMEYVTPILLLIAFFLEPYLAKLFSKKDQDSA